MAKINYDDLQKDLETAMNEIKDEINRMQSRTGRPQLGKAGCLRRLMVIHDKYFGENDGTDKAGQ